MFKNKKIDQKIKSKKISFESYLDLFKFEKCSKFKYTYILEMSEFKNCSYFKNV
jgi:hypothetical protein